MSDHELAEVVRVVGGAHPETLPSLIQDVYRALTEVGKGGAIESSTPTPKQLSDDEIATQEIDNILSRLDSGIAREQKSMDALLSRLRTTLIAA